MTETNISMNTTAVRMICIGDKELASRS